MEIQIQLIVTIGIIFLLIVLLVANRVDWRAVAVRWVGNNPNHGQCYIKAGDTVKTYEAERINCDTEGQTYLYKPDGKRIPFQIVVLPVDKLNEQTKGIIPGYPYLYIRGRRIIGIDDGRIVPNPLGFMDAQSVLAYREGVSDLSEVTLSNVLVKAIQSIKSNKVGTITMYLIIGAIVVAGIVYYVRSQTEAPASQLPPATANVTVITPREIPAQIPVNPEIPQGVTIP